MSERPIFGEPAKKKANLALSEIRFQHFLRIDLLEGFRQNDPQAMVILFSGTASTSHVIEAMRLGAYDVLGKERLPYELRSVVESALKAISPRSHPRLKSRGAHRVHSGNHHRSFGSHAGGL
ncbi:MAG: hypothetical protein R3F13_16105 [Prosthecobacter sp.]